MTDPSHAETQPSSSLRQRPSELLRTYVSDPEAPRADEVQRLVSELDIHQSELEVQNQRLQAVQRQLEAYRDRYIDLYDFAPLGYVTLDQDGYIQEINLAGAWLLGGERAELVGYPFADYVVAADRATFLEHIRKCCGQHQDMTSELGLITKDGRSLVVQLHSVPVESLEHEGTFGKTAITDITDRKRAEEAIQEERNLLRTLIDNLPDSIYVKDAQGRFVTANLAAARLTGAATLSDLLGKSDFDFYSEEVAAEYFSDERELVRSGEPLINKDEPHLDPQGNPRTVLTTKVPLKDSRGTVIGLVGISRDITEQRQAEKALRESEQFYRTLIETLPVTVVLASPQGLATYISPAAKEMFDIAPGEGLGTVPTDWIAPEHHESVRQRMRAVMVELRPQPPIEYKILKRDRTPVWAQVASAPFLDSEGRLAGVVTVCQDVTARKQAEQSLRESEARFRALYEQAPLGIALINSRTGQFLQINPKYREIIRRSEEEMRKLTFQSITYPEDLQADLDNMARLIEGKIQFFNMEKRLFRGDGSLIWISLTVVPMWEKGQVPYSHIAIIEDITERKRVEEALRESQERLRLSLESAELGWWSWDFAAGSLEGDNKTKSLLGSPDATVPFAGILERTHPDDRSSLQEHTSELQSRAGNYEVEFRVVWPDGSIHWVSARGRSFANVEGKPVRAVGIAMDITERKRAEEEVAAAKASAEQANRAKDHFLAVLSHELRTPLTPVVMGVSMLQDRPDLAPDIRETLEMVRRNAEMEARLIDDLLDVTRIARGKIELTRSAVELCTVIRRAVEVCQPDIDARRLDFGVDWGPSAPYWVEADVPRLQQVFWNLLRNAIKFTPHGGCIGIRCRPDAAYVVIEVNDSGMGIELESLSRVFDAFEQVEQSITRQFGGLGLGLAISKALVEMHGGTISAHSEGKDMGATFSIRLPLAAPAGQPEPPATVAPPHGAVRPLHILLVEDHGVTAKMLGMVLTLDGHDVETAGDVATALDLAEKHAFDLLLSDLGLPDGSGHDLMRQLRERGYKFPGIALSGYGQAEDIQQSREAGFAAHLTKPASGEAVVEAIASVTAGS